MWDVGQQKELKTFDIIEKSKLLPEKLTDEEAKVSLCEFLRYNLGFTMELVSGQRLLPIQEIVLNGLFLKDYSLTVAGRGIGKSWLIAVFCALYPIFYPGVKICIVANNYRRSRSIFEQIEKFCNHKEALLLRQCFNTKPRKLNDCLSWELSNGSVIFALPLSNGEGLRGTRANVLIIDEALLISESIQENVLRPFLTAKQDVKERMEIQNLETDLVNKGLLKEEDKTDFQNNKMILMSSASYQFEYLYKIYLNYIDNIKNPKPDSPSYFTSRISYDAIPKSSIIDDSVIQAAQSGGASNATFQREYGAMFVDASDGYFNVRNLHECTVKDGDFPTIQIKGQPGARYILAIDPSYSASKSSDFFAMGVYMLLPEERKIVQVHTYGQAGKDLKEHFEYLTYLLTHFDIEYLIIDGSGTEFIDGYNESTLAKERNINLGFIDVDFEADNYMEQIHKAQNQISKSSRKFVYAQKFTSDSVRRMNEYLQAGVAAKKVWFASRISANEDMFKRSREIQLPFAFKNQQGQDYSISEFLEDQDDWIEQTKKQLALIEVSTSPLGSLKFDLPNHLKKSTSETRARRDNYTALLMAYTASKHLYDIFFSSKEEEQVTFTPFCW